MSKIKALQQQIESLRSENENLRKQLKTLREEALDLFRWKNGRIRELESQNIRVKT